MKVYSEIVFELTYKDFIKKIESAIKAVQETEGNDHDLIRELFITFCEFHTAAADKIFEKEEYNHPIITRFSHAELSLALMLYYSWKKKKKDPLQYLNIFLKYFEKLSHGELPGKLAGKLPEGYAFYGHYPEAFFLSAEKFYKDYSPETVYCIGIRSIGISFAAAAAAYLDDKGCSIHLTSVRTRGDYENRYISIDPSYLVKLNSNKNAYYLIADEGSGLSGSSFDITAEFLSSRGISDNKIIFLSTSGADSKDLKHKSYHTSFDELWINSGKLKELIETDNLTDLSCGKWKDVISVSNDGIVIDPDEEKKKFLTEKEDGKYLVKFIGLGSHGKDIYTRLKKLSESGFVPDVIKYTGGFLISKFILGEPLNQASHSKEFLKFAADYFSFIEENFKSEPSKNPDELFEMILENIKETMGEEWCATINEHHDSFINHIRKEASYIDRNIHPYEWIKSSERFYKTDAAEHSHDQRFPGCQNIAWDIAGFLIDFQLKEEEINYFLSFFKKERFPNLVNDLPYYYIAYLSYRIGYLSIKSDIYKNSEYGDKFLKLKEQVSCQLKEKIKNLQ